MTISITSRLCERGDFLHLSRTQPELFAVKTRFSTATGVKVEIAAPGIITFVTEQSAGKAIVLSCGVHGNETAPIEICDELVGAILTGEITPAQNVLFLFGNLAAMDTGSRFIEENMNRLFSGAHSEGKGLCNDERHRAKLLEESVSDFFTRHGEGKERIHYDLHTAIRDSKNEKFAVYPFLHGRAHSKAQLSFLSRCGVSTILLSGSPTTTFSYYSSHQHGAHAFTVELGKVRPFGENDMSRFAAAKEALTDLLCQIDLALPGYRESDFELYQVHRVIDKAAEDFRLNFSDDVANFTDFPVGFCLAEETGNRYEVEVEGEAIIFPNADVAIGQRALLTVVPGHLVE